MMILYHGSNIDIKKIDHGKRAVVLIIRKNGDLLEYPEKLNIDESAFHGII